MTLSFIETMSGALVDNEGRRHAVDFQVRATQIGRGRFALDGIAHAGAFVSEAPCTGTLTLSLSPAAIAYDVRFEDSEGRAFAIAGAKSPRITAPLRSMTELPVKLTRDDVVVATGPMGFDLFELGPFLSSWLPLATEHRRRFEARHTAVVRQLWAGDRA